MARLGWFALGLVAGWGSLLALGVALGERSSDGGNVDFSHQVLLNLRARGLNLDDDSITKGLFNQARGNPVDLFEWTALLKVSHGARSTEELRPVLRKIVDRQVRGDPHVDLHALHNTVFTADPAAAAQTASPQEEPPAPPVRTF